jgi:PAS domain S-box-containing protein
MDRSQPGKDETSKSEVDRDPRRGAGFTERRLRLILEQLPINICTVNRDFRITFADGPHVRALGNAGGEVIGRRVIDFVDREEIPKIEQIFRHALEGRSTTYETHFQGRTYLANASPFFDSNKATIGAICGFLDITRTNEVEGMIPRGPDDQAGLFARASNVFSKGVSEHQSSVKAVREALKESEAFSQNVAHELRGHLRTLSMNGEVLLQDYSHSLDEAGRALIKRMLRSTQRLDELTQDLLAFSRLEKLDLHPDAVDVTGSIRAVMDTMMEDLVECCADVHLAGPFFPVRCHAQFLELAIRNLMENAVKYVLPGVNPRITLQMEKRGGQVRLWVEDNGIGIHPDHQARIFLGFERLRPEYPGTGIGLAMVKKGIERMGGTMGVESKEGAGSRFWIDLPPGNLSP